MISKALQTKLFRIKIDSLGKKIPKFPEFNLEIVEIRRKFEVPQWNISLNDSGIQVTLFWAEKCSPTINSNQGTILIFFHSFKL